MNFNSVMRRAFAEELMKIAASKEAGAASALGGALAKKPGALQRVGEHLMKHDHAYDLAGLGVLAAPSAIDVGQQVSNAAQGRPVDKHHLGHGLTEIGGLGILAAPVAAHLKWGKHLCTG